MIFNILFMFVFLFLCLFSILCILCFLCIALCIVFPFVYSCLFPNLYKFTDHFHRVKTQFQ